MTDEMPKRLVDAMNGAGMTDSDRWALLTGYVARMVGEGSSHAREVWDYMCELKPSTRVFGEQWTRPDSEEQS